MDAINQLLEAGAIFKKDDHYETVHGLSVNYDKIRGYAQFCCIVYYPKDFGDPTLIIRHPSLLFQDVIDMNVKLTMILQQLPMSSTIIYNHNNSQNVIAVFHKNFKFRLYIHELQFIILNDDCSYYNDILFKTADLDQIINYICKLVLHKK